MNRKIYEMMLKSDVEAGAKVLEEAKRTLLRAVEEVERVQKRYAGDPSTIGTCKSVEAQALGEAVHYLTANVVGNIRFDLMLAYAAKIEAARAVANLEDES